MQGHDQCSALTMAFKRRRMFALSELNASSRCCAGLRRAQNEMDAGSLGERHHSGEYEPGVREFADCLAAEEQMRKHYADAFDGWDRAAAINFQRQRDYVRARDLQAKRMLSNVGTCMPHAG
jgi:hypothetical protein